MPNKKKIALAPVVHPPYCIITQVCPRIHRLWDLSLTLEVRQSQGR